MPSDITLHVFFQILGKLGTLLCIILLISAQPKKLVSQKQSKLPLSAKHGTFRINAVSINAFRVKILQVHSDEYDAKLDEVN